MAIDTVRCERIARAIASDISIYNKDKIQASLENDDFFEALADNIEEGRKAFEQRVGSEAAASNIYYKALNDVIIAANPSLKSKIF